jgi:hypothetical protein
MGGAGDPLFAVWVLTISLGLDLGGLAAQLDGAQLSAVSSGALLAGDRTGWRIRLPLDWSGHEETSEEISRQISRQRGDAAPVGDCTGPRR